MFEVLRQLFIEQRSAPELASFIVAVTVCSVIAAMALYVVIMTLVWVVRLRPAPTWRDTIVPDLVRFRHFTWEYVLTLATSAVLALTLANKHEIVDAVLELPADSILGSQQSLALLPLRRTPTARELGEPGSETVGQFKAYLEHQAGTVFNLQVADMLRPSLMAGRDGEVRGVVDDVLRRVMDRSPTLRAEFERWLLRGCFVLFGVYLLWLVRMRTRRFNAPAQSDGSPSGEAVRRFALIGMCLALLLATPALARDPESLADATMEAIRVHRPAPGPAATADTLLTRAIDSQYELQAVLRTLADIPDSANVMGALRALGVRITRLNDSLADVHGQIAGLSARIAEARADIGAHDTALSGLREALEELTVAQNSLRNTVLALGDSITRYGGRFNDVSARLDTVADQAARADRLARALGERLAVLINTEVLLVETGARYPYRIRDASDSVVGSGSGHGLHRLPPGVYILTSGVDADTVRLRRGTPRWVTLTPIAAVQ